MAGKSVITYIAPKDRFVMVSNSIVDKYNIEVVGVYCKLVKLSSGKSLSIDFIAKKIKVNERKIRKIVVFLEDEGYIVRKPLRGEDGYMNGWNYLLYAEPVPKSERSHAGKKVKKENEEKPVLPKNRQDGKPSKTEKGQGNNILSNTDVLSNIEEINIDNKKEISSDISKKPEDFAFESYMKEHYPYLMRMDIPLTREQAGKLKKTYGEEAILQIFDDMNNYKPLLKNSRDAYKTALNWCRRRNLPIIQEEDEQ